MGTELTVALTSDETVKRDKGRLINPWDVRAAMLLELRCVDRVVLTHSACEAIRRLRPQVFVKGIDYLGGHSFTEDIEKACKETGTMLRYTASPKTTAASIIRKALK